MLLLVKMNVLLSKQLQAPYQSEQVLQVILIKETILVYHIPHTSFLF